METTELRKLWKTLAEENLIDRKLAKENILEIITQEGNGVISKIQRKLRLDFNVYLAIAILIPLLTLFVIYHDIQYPNTKTIAELSRQYTILGLFEALAIFALMSLRRSMNFIEHTHITGTLKDSLTHVKSYFKAIRKRGFWIGTVLMIAVFVFIGVDTLMKIGGVSSLNFSWSRPYVYESYFLVFIMILIISIPLIVRLDAKKYASVLYDLDQTIEELNEEE